MKDRFILTIYLLGAMTFSAKAVIIDKGWRPLALMAFAAMLVGQAAEKLLKTNRSAKEGHSDASKDL